MQSSLNQISAASSSAARAIHRKIVPPNPVQAEREDFERSTFVALQKAINTDEVPAKEKHVRTLIIGTFQEKGAHTFWSLVLSRVPVQGSPVVAWKSCYVIHKLLRDGHSNVIKDSMRHQPFIQDLGRLWGHLKLGYGPLITRYCELLAVKLDFHRKNPRFPGNLHIGGDELQKIAENDPNNYFQLTVEMFDYMENILELAAAVFGSFDMSRANSMTAVGQSRLVAIIPCILDSCQLYDFIVKMMFKLHTALPQDVLAGHRERFTKQFKLLQHLYHSSSNLQYFKNLIQIPSLPERAPNFLSAVSIKEYVTPVAREQEQPEDVGGDSEGILIDTTNMNGNNRENETPSTNGFGNSINDQENSLTVKDRVIEELLQEIERLRRVTDKIKSDDLVVIDDLRNRVVELERDSEEQRAQTEMERLELMRQVKQSAQNPQVMANFEELDKRAKVADDKFKKLKEVYNELREKHVGLLRDHATTEKQYKTTKKSLEDTERQKNELNVEVMNFNMEKEQMQRSLEDTSASVQRQLEEKAEECALLEKRLAEADSESRSLTAANDNMKADLEAIQLREKELTRNFEELSETSKADKEHWNQRIESLTISSQEVFNEKEQELTSLKMNLQDVEAELRSVTSAKSRLELDHEATLRREKDLQEAIDVQKESFAKERETLLQSMQNSAGVSQMELAKSLAEQEVLRTKVTEVEGELQASTEANRSLSADQEALLKREAALQQELEAERVHANSEIMKLRESMESARTLAVNELQGKSGELSVMERRLRELEQELVETQIARASTEAERETLLVSEKALQEQLRLESTTSAARMEQLKHDMEAAETLAQTQFQTQALEIFSLEQRLRGVEVELENTQAAKDSVELEREKLMRNERALQNQLELELKNSAAEVGQFREEMEKARALSAEESRIKTAELAALEQRLGGVEVELEKTQTAKADVELEREKLMRNERALQNQLELELKNSAAEVGQFREEMEKARALSAEESRIKTAELAALEQRLGGVEVELEKTQTAKADVELEREKLAQSGRALQNQLEFELKSSAASIEQLREEMENARVLSAEESRTKTAELLAISERFREVERELGDTAAAKASVDLERERLLQSEKVLQQQLSTQSTTASLQTEQLRQSMDSAKNTAQQEIQNKTNEIILLEKRLKEVEEELGLMSKSKSEVETERDSVLQRENELTVQLKIYSEKASVTEAEANHLVQTLEDLRIKSRSDLRAKEVLVQSLTSRVASLESELQSVTESRQSFKTDYETSLKQQKDLKEDLVTLESDFESINFQHALETRGLRQSLFNVTCGTAAEEIKHTVTTWEHPSFTMLTSTPEFLLACIEPALDHLRQLRTIPVGQEDHMNELSKEILLTFHHISHCLIQCMETSHMAPIDLTDEFSLLAKQIGEESVEYLNGFRTDPQGVAALLGGLEEKLEVLQQLSTVLIPKVEDVRSDEVADMVEKELHDMDKAIEEAALKIEEMLVNSRSRDTGVKLEVNAKILDSCTTLMAAIRILVRKSRALQQEIMAAGKGFSSPKEFYKKNHRWTEGLISAAKTVGLGANVLLQAADKVVSGKGKFEELVVASQEVSAGTVQLVVSSKVKAERNSTTLAELSKASKSVTQAAGAVVATSKSCAQLVEEKADLDFSSLSLHKIKKIEMDAQVKVLELESALTKEREKLASIRRQHYALAGTTEDGDGDNTSGVS